MVHTMHTFKKVPKPHPKAKSRKHQLLLPSSVSLSTSEP
jgi:hypothetical protein